MQTIVATATRLRLTVAAKQHSPAWLAPARRQSTRHQFGLVVAATIGASPTRWRPGDDVDLGRIEPTAELLGEMMGKPTPITELQAENEFFGKTRKLRCSQYSPRGGYWRRGREREPTTTTQIDPGLPATSATNHQHGPVVAKGCDEVAEVLKPASGWIGRTGRTVSAS
jgi:hypothetical protein